MKGVCFLNVEAIVKDKFELIKSIRKELNENPELSFKEYKTSDIIKRYLKSFGIETKSSFNTGVIGVLNKDELCIGVRADMDALPVNGVSHACGHDYHMAVALGVAVVLKELAFDKNVKFIFQPGEEESGGALPMIKEGVLEAPEVKYVIGFHGWPGLPVGKIQVSAGPSMGSVDDFKITFKGKGGHAAMPELFINPINPATDLIQSFNKKIEIENNPKDPVVVTFAAINAGNAYNVVPDEARVLGTVRTFNPKYREKIKNDLINEAKSIGEKYKCSVSIEYKDGYPPLINDSAMADLFIETSKKVLGEQNVLPLNRTFAAEDFSFFTERVPGIHFRFGIMEGDKGKEVLHSAKFQGSDNSLYYAVLAVVCFIYKLRELI